MADGPFPCTDRRPTFLFNIASGTAGDLQSAAGMAGNDDTATQFAAKYEPAAITVIDGIDKAGEGMYGVAERLMTTARNYVMCDNEVARALLGNMTPAPHGARAGSCDPTKASATLPKATGAEESSSIPIIGHFWPQGNPDKLRAAAATWARCGELIDQAQQNAAQHTWPLITAWDGDAYEAFKDYEARLFADCPSGGRLSGANAPFMEDLSAACRALAEACTGYAQAIDDCRSQIIKLGIAAGVITAIGGILTFVTFGGSSAAAATADTALAADAAATVLVMEAAMSRAVAAAAIAEAEAIVAAAARKILTGAVAAIAVSSVDAVTGPDTAQASTYLAGNLGSPLAAINVVPNTTATLRDHSSLAARVA